MTSSVICKENANAMCFRYDDTCKDEDESAICDYRNDYDGEVMDFSETSAKASSSSMHDSITNMSNSHSTPDDNYSENAILSPVNNKHLLKYDVDCREVSSPNLYSIESAKLSLNNSQSIEDTIESVLTKICVKNECMHPKVLSPIVNQANGHPMLHSSTAMENRVQTIKPENHSVHNAPSTPNTNSQYYNDCNYGGFYVSQLGNVHNTNYNQFPRSVDKNKFVYCQFPYQNNHFRQYSNPSYPNQFYYPNSAFPVYQKPLKRNFENNFPVMDDYSYSYPNFKVPQSNSNSVVIEPCISRKKRASNEKMPSGVKKRKTALNLPTNTINNYEEILMKLKLPSYNSLLTNPQFIPSSILLPPQGFLDPKSKSASKKSKYRKYRSSIYSLSSVNYKTATDPDKYISSYVEDSCANQNLLTTKQQSDLDEYLDIICGSPSTERQSQQLLKNLSHADNSDRQSRPLSPEITPSSQNTASALHDKRCLPEVFKAQPDFRMIQDRTYVTPVVSYTDNEAKLLTELPLDYHAHNTQYSYVQLNGSFLKRTKINGKSFSNIHIEEAVSLASLTPSKNQYSCFQCNSTLIGRNSIKKRTSHDAERGQYDSESDERLFCSSSCYSAHDNGPDRPINGVNTQSYQSAQIIIKSTPFKSSKNCKKVCDFEQYVRRRFPSEGQNDVTPKSCQSEKVETTETVVRKKRFGDKFGYFKNETLQPLNQDLPKSDQNFLLSRYSCSYKAENLTDLRQCILCESVGDADENICGRLINIDADNWVHLNCALWCFEVFETVSGSLMELSSSLQKALKTMCSYCNKLGAGIQCYRSKCVSIYHIPCAYKIGCIFYTDRGMYCPVHAVANHPMNLPTLNVNRRVVAYRDESQLVASTVNCDENDNKAKFRTGSLILNSIGQLLPEQLTSGKFNSSSIIYPVGYHASRIYWSMNDASKRCKYECFIEEENNQPTFNITVYEKNIDPVYFQDLSCDNIWRNILLKIAKLREESGLTKLFPVYLSGEQLYGLTEPHIIRLIESLPGVEMIKNYAFKFGKMQLITEMPLAINPTGSARTEPKLRTYVRRSQHDQASKTNQCGVLKAKNSQSYLYELLSPTKSVIGGNYRCIQYKKMKSEWMDNVILSRSKIQGLGLFAARDFEKSTIIIEYIGELIRSEVGNRRESMYQARNNSIYMFRLNEDTIIDATVEGGLARYINHSCNPNCVAETLSLEFGDRIVITTKQKLQKGDELTYDYKFDFEDNTADRIPCLCGSINCRKWMN